MHVIKDCINACYKRLFKRFYKIHLINVIKKIIIILNDRNN